MITLKKELCTNCGICLDVCPNYCFDATSPKDIKLVNPNQCCVCGHCISLCAPKALSHEAIPHEELTSFRFPEITAEDMQQLLLGRRSIRKYKNQTVPDEFLEKLLYVGEHAATSSNGQSEGFIVIQNRKKLEKLELLVIRTLWDAGLKYLDGRIIKKLLMKKYGMEIFRQYSAYHGIIKYRRANKDESGMVFRNAPAVIIVHGIKTNYLAQTNAALALRNMEIMALTMGLGTCHVGLLTTAVEKNRKINTFLDIPKTNTVLGAIMVGYPKYNYPSILPRKSRSVEWIR